MRVLMVQCIAVENASQERVYPIGIVSLAGRLQKSGHEVAVLDMNLGTDPYGALKEKLLSYQPDVVGLSLRNIDPLANKTVSLVPPFTATVRLVRRLLPQARIVVGGTAFSLFPKRLMQELPEIDYGIVGEAEETLPALLASIDHPPSLKGLCLRDGGKILVNPPSTEIDMARYDPPQRLFLDPGPYVTMNSYVPSIGIETKRGCPFDCSYCVYPKLQGKKLRCRQPAAVVDEMEYLHREYGVQSFHFTDPVINIPHGHLEEICREILRRKLNVKWDGFMREDYLDEKNVFLFAKAGCECFSFSPDGLCQQSLDILGKNLRVEDITKAASLVAQTDVVSVYHFMVNVPGENEQTIAEGINLIEQIFQLHSKKKNLGTIVLNNIRILPDTPIAAKALANGVITPETDLLYPVYYNPRPFESLRYKLETLHLCRNIFMWQGVQDENSIA